MKTKLLHELEYDQKGHIAEIDLSGDIRRRLSDMGIVSGGEIQLVRVAPLGDPIEIKIKGYELSLRKEIASRILVIPDDFMLVEAPQGKPVIINRISGGQKAVQRLSKMGFVIGTQLTVTENVEQGPVRVNINGQTVYLGQGMAHKVMVKEIADA